MAINPLTDSVLLKAFLRGDEASFEELVRRHERMVFNVCLRFVADEHAAEDAAQAVFIALSHKAVAVQDRKNIANWLYKVAWHISSRQKTSQMQRLKHEFKASAISSSPNSAQPDPEREELARQLDRELHALPEKYLAPLLLHYYDGFSEEEGARTLGLALGTFSSRISRARDMLRKRLNQKGATVSAALMAGLLVSARENAAEIPANFALRTAQAAGAIAAGNPATGLISSRATSLANDALNSIFRIQLAKWTAACAALLAAFLMLAFSTRPLAKRPAPSQMVAAVVPPTQRMEEKLSAKIDFDVRFFMPEEVLIELRNQTGIEFIWPWFRSVERRFSFDRKDVPVRQVLAQFCREYGMEFKVQSDAVLVWPKLDDSRRNQLTLAAKTGNSLNRADAAFELTQLGDVQALPVLIDLLNDPDELVLYWTVFGLERNMGPPLGYSEKSEAAASSLLCLLQNRPPSISRRNLLSLIVKTVQRAP